MYNDNVRELFDRVEQISNNLDRILEKAELWQQIVDQCPIGIAVFTANMNFFLVNKEFLEITGYKNEELIDERISLVIPDNLRKMHMEKEKQFAGNPEKLTNRHGLSPVILSKHKMIIPITIDLSFIQHDSKVYYVAFIKKVVNTTEI